MTVIKFAIFFYNNDNEKNDNNDTNSDNNYDITLIQIRNKDKAVFSS